MLETVKCSPVPGSTSCVACTLYRVEMTKEGKEECPMCRELKSMSLLTKMTIENLKHDCTKGAS